MKDNAALRHEIDERMAHQPPPFATQAHSTEVFSETHFQQDPELDFHSESAMPMAPSSAAAPPASLESRGRARSWAAGDWKLAAGKLHGAMVIRDSLHYAPAPAERSRTTSGDESALQWPLPRSKTSLGGRRGMDLRSIAEAAAVQPPSEAQPSAPASADGLRAADGRLVPAIFAGTRLRRRVSGGPDLRAIAAQAARAQTALQP